MKFKKRMAAVAFDLIHGKKISIMDGFKKYGYTNLPREVSRAFEQKFNVSLEREKVEYKIHGEHRTYHLYSLVKRKQRKDSVKKIYKYIQENMIPPSCGNASLF